MEIEKQWEIVFLEIGLEAQAVGRGVIKDCARAKWSWGYFLRF